jgi:hypothetical protein
MNIAKRTFTNLAAVLLLTVTSVFAASGNAYYRWVDENGTTVNSDYPPPHGIDYETISTGSTLHRPSPTKTAPLPEPGNPVEPTGQQTATEQPQTAARNPDACKAARQNLDTLTTKARVRVRDSEGRFRFLTEDEKAAQRELAEAAITRECE